MTDNKLLEVLGRYETALHEPRVQRDMSVSHIAHLASMLGKMRAFLREGRREKLMRWLGFAQGVLWCDGIYTIEELMQHNMADGAEFFDPWTIERGPRDPEKED